MIRVGGTYRYGRLPDDGPLCVFVVVSEEPWWPPRPPSGHIPSPGFRILVLDGELRGGLERTPTTAGQEMLVASSSAIACDSKPYDGSVPA